MNTPIRLEQALLKLYNAFHNDTLNPECCKQCAVGNILDNTDAWKHFSEDHGSLTLNYIGMVNQKFGRRFNGYSPLELLQIEATFLSACGYSLPLRHNGLRPQQISDDSLFNGLDAVIDFLCQLDGVVNTINYKKLFKTKTENSTELAI